MVTMDNAEEYVELMFDFCMHTGIQKQMEAFRGMTGLAGFKYSHALHFESAQATLSVYKSVEVHVTWLFRYQYIMNYIHYYIIHISYKYGVKCEMSVFWYRGF